VLVALSHESGSPLAAIKGAATTLIDYRQRLPDYRIDGFLRSIDTQTVRLNDLLDDVILLAKIQTGTLRRSRHPPHCAARSNAPASNSRPISRLPFFDRR
jgi:K+-sensing histidine kinase KdpD